jgi:hypothetical protein
MYRKRNERKERKEEENQRTKIKGESEKKEANIMQYSFC